MDRENLLIVCGAVLGAGYLLTQHYASQASNDTEPATEPETTLLDDLVNTTRNALQLWRPPAKYAGLIAQAERAYGLPVDLLARLLYQECRYREDIITGQVASPAGALGIAQFMPATAAEWGIRPLDPASAIDGAGRYLKWLRAKFSSWSETLAAYNWGIGNMQRIGLAKAPKETRLYYTQILGDINTTNGTKYA